MERVLFTGKHLLNILNNSHKKVAFFVTYISQLCYIVNRAVKRVKMSNIAITIIGIAFIFLMTTLGSLVVFIFKRLIKDKIKSLMLGFASGLMIATSVWSMLLPAISQSEGYGVFSFLPATLGVILGCLFLVVLDKIIPWILSRKKEDEGNYVKSQKLFLAVTIHNIPEGLAVGLAFGSAFVVGQTSAFLSALWLAVGIGIQNFPEGTTVALTIKDMTGSRKRGFWYGFLSGVVEPIVAVLGIFLATIISQIMPWLLSFAAGAMLFVVVEELMPDIKVADKGKIGSWGFIAGFILMMILDVAFG